MKRVNKLHELKRMGNSYLSVFIRGHSRNSLTHFFFLLFSLFPIVSGCERRQTDSVPLVAVSIVPQEWFVARIGGERARTLALAGQGQNPHNYEPTPRQIKGLAGAGVWILSGAEFEITLRPKVEKLFPALPIVNGTEGVVLRRLDYVHDDGDAHDGDGGHAGEPAGEFDRHTWLGREPAKILAGHIRDTLFTLDPAGTAFYADNYDRLVREIDAEFDALRRDLAPLRGTNIFVYHPSFGYFLDEFGIRQQAVETGGKTPGPRELGRLIALAKREQPAAIFVQAQFPVSAARTVADAVGAVTVSLDPLAPDWLANIRRMGDALLASRR